MSEGSGEALGFERVVFFSDAVFAIVITILVLPLTAEFEAPDEAVDLLLQLQELTPRIITFLFSFLVVGQFWMAHHRLFGMTVRADGGLLLWNLVYLLTISFMPFPAAVLGTVETDSDQLPVVFFAASMTAASLALTAMFLYVRRRGLLDPALSPDRVADFAVGSLVTLAVFVLAVAVAFVSTLGALACWIVVMPVARRLVRRVRRPVG